MVNGAAATGELVPPKRIPVNGRPIRLRWLQQVIWSFLAANVGALIIAGLYYLVIQVRWHLGSHTYLFLKPSWDHLFSYGGWVADRHNIRDVYEALLATLFVKSLLANWRKGVWRAPAWYVLLSPMGGALDDDHVHRPGYLRRLRPLLGRKGPPGLRLAGPERTRPPLSPHAPARTHALSSISLPDGPRAVGNGL